MMGKFTFEDGINDDRQMGSYQNGTQTTLGNDETSITIGVTPSFPDGVDSTNATAVEAYLREAFKPLVDQGFVVEIQYGPMSGND